VYFSARQQEVVRLVVRGYTNRPIAEELVIAEPRAELPGRARVAA
jgi:DNA-binding NarL/FixJ family response regulator